ncbi:hypothetical protein Trydic_g23019 [Trypoxylus dichotomus]
MVVLTENTFWTNYAMGSSNTSCEYETPRKLNATAAMLSRPFVEFPSFSYEEVRGQQLGDPELEKIMRALEGEDIQKATRWAERDYVMNNGVLYHYKDAEDPQLVVPTSMRVTIMKEYHDAPTAGHYGVEKTFQRISSKYYSIGMRRYIQEYVKSYLVGLLPETPRGHNWILIVKDTASKWTELFAIQAATAEACARILIEVFLRYGTPRKIIADNGVQFVSHITPYLRKLGRILEESKELAQRKKDQRKVQADKARTSVQYNIGELVLMKSHSLSDAKKGYTSKFAPKRDGPYKALKTITPTTNELGTCADPSQLIGRYHVSDIWAYHAPLTAGTTPEPVGMKRRRGRPKKMSVLDNAVGPTLSPEGESVMRQDFETRATRKRRLPGWMRNYIQKEQEELVIYVNCSS